MQSSCPYGPTTTTITKISSKQTIGTTKQQQFSAPLTAETTAAISMAATAAMKSPALALPIYGIVLIAVGGFVLVLALVGIATFGVIKLVKYFKARAANGATVAPAIA